MKKTSKVLLILILPLVTLKQQIQCQSILGVEASYGFPWAGDEISDGNITSTEQEIREIEVINWSFGAGRNYSISFSHFLTSSIEAKCIVSYMDGSTVNRTVKFPISNSFSSYKANAIWLSPTLIFNLGKKKVRPYVYAGFMFGAGPKIFNSNKTTTNNATTESKFVFSGGSVYGISSGIGIKFYLKKNAKWYFSSEAKLISASYGPKRGELVKYNIDDTDLLGSLTINEKKVIYKDKYTVDEAIPPVPDEPAVFSRRFYPFSSLGLNAGVFYTL